MRLNSKGSSHLVAVLAVVVVIAVGYAGYTVYKAGHVQQTASNSTAAPAAAVTTAPQIKKTSDLTKADSTLNQLNSDKDLNDLSQIEKDMGSL